MIDLFVVLFLLINLWIVHDATLLINLFNMFVAQLEYVLAVVTYQEVVDDCLEFSTVFEASLHGGLDGVVDDYERLVI